MACLLLINALPVITCSIQKLLKDVQVGTQNENLT